MPCALPACAAVSGCPKPKPDSMPICSSVVRAMCERYKLTPKGNGWAIMARKGAGAATDAAWLCLGGCPSHMTAMRIYLALTLRKGR